jgi:hypothetical protein
VKISLVDMIFHGRIVIEVDANRGWVNAVGLRKESLIFFVDTTGMLASTLPADSSPERIAQEVRSLLDQ